MKFDIATPPNDGKLHVFCVTCKADGTEKRRIDGETVFVCPNGHRNARALYYGGVKFWIAEDKELWHESIGVFVRNSEGKYLFADRTEFPFGLAVPAGHVDEHETADMAATRELQEETGIVANALNPLFTTDVHGDSCSGGSDVHRWHVYGYNLPEDQKVVMNEESKRPLWLTLAEARKQESPYLMQYFFKHHFEQLKSW